MKKLQNSRHMLMDGDIPRQLKQAIRLRDDYTCAMCGKKSRNPRQLSMEVHHITYISSDVELSREPENLITLCQHCHDKFHAQCDVNPKVRRIESAKFRKIAKSRASKFHGSSKHVGGQSIGGDAFAAAFAKAAMK